MTRIPAPFQAHLLLAAERDQWAGARVASEPGAILLLREEDSRDVALAVGEPGAVARLLANEARLRAGRGAPLWLSATAGSSLAEDVLEGLGVVAGFGWEWFAVAGPGQLTVPDVPARGVRLGPLDLVRDDAAIRDVLRLANPRSTADPAGDREVRWWGAWLGQDLVGVIGAAREQGVPASGEAGFSWHLHGLAVLPVARGRGLGAALTSAITVAGLDAGADFVSLGIYSDNDRARAIYQRLGYTRHAAMTAYRPTPQHPR